VGGRGGSGGVLGDEFEFHVVEEAGVVGVGGVEAEEDVARRGEDVG
jgi:hypothetical protein